MIPFNRRVTVTALPDHEQPQRDAFDAGRIARKLRKSVNDVPHPRGSSERYWWIQGWEAENRDREPNTYSVGDGCEGSEWEGTYRKVPTNNE